MTKQEILDECARRVGDEDAGFKSGQLSKAFSFVLLELSQHDCLSLLRKQTTFQFNDAACVPSSGVLQVDTQALLGLADGQYPERITDDLFVPGWGVTQSRILRLSDLDFNNHWLGAHAAHTGRPRYWRVFPSLAQLQIWPVPDSASVSATCLVEWMAPPTLITDATNITEILPSDLPTVLAGLYRYGILYRDETLNDQALAEARWREGVQLMKERRHKAEYYGRRNQITYREF